MVPSLVRRIAGLTLLGAVVLGAWPGSAAAGPPVPAYPSFNYQMDLGRGLDEAAFAEASGLSPGEQSAEFLGPELRPLSRSHPWTKPGKVTLKRGLIKVRTLLQWVDQGRRWGVPAKRTVIVRLLNEDRTAVVTTWRLHGTYPLTYLCPTLAANAGGDVAAEVLVLSIDRLTVE